MFSSAGANVRLKQTELWADRHWRENYFDIFPEQDPEPRVRREPSTPQRGHHLISKVGRLPLTEYLFSLVLPGASWSLKVDLRR
jgi:hypothetical protein